MDILLIDVSITVIESIGPDAILITSSNICNICNIYNGAWPFNGEQEFKVMVAKGEAKNWLNKNFIDKDFIDSVKFISDKSK